jgi:uncharacterized membrane protein
MVKDISKETVKNPQFTPVNNTKRHKFNVFLDKFSKNEDLKSDISAGFYIVQDIILSGFLLSLALIVFNHPFSILGMFSLGSCFWFVSNKIFPMVKDLLLSFRLVSLK